MQIELFENFNKKINSTKQPKSGTLVDCFLKESTSIENPHFILSNISFSVNYVKWENRYYFINDIISLKNNLIEISCSEDVLATFKTDIMNMTAFVNYSSSNYDLNILDNRIGTVADLHSSVNSVACEGFNDGGCYCITCVGNGDANLNRYYTYDTGLNSLAKKVVSIDADLINDIVLQFGNCVNAISSIMFIPFNTLSVYNTTIYLGKYNTEIPAWQTTDKYVYKTVSVDIPWINSEISRRGFETIELYLPFIGTVNLNAELFKNNTSITIQYAMDYISGGITFIVGGFYTFSASCGVPISMGIYQTDITKIPTTLALKTADYLSSSALEIIGKTSKDYTFDISNKTSDVGTNFSTIGNMGGYDGVALVLEGYNKINIRNSSHSFTDSVGSLKDIAGNPLFKKVQLKTLSGFVQCNGASVDCTALENSKEKINTFLNTGFFIE